MATILSQYRRVAPALVDLRTARRHHVTVTRATLHRDGEPPSTAVLEDLSIYGCRLAAAGEERTGERLLLRFDHGADVAATVAWAKAGTIGCRFDTPIDRALMRRLTLND